MEVGREDAPIEEAVITLVITTVVTVVIGTMVTVATVVIGTMVIVATVVIETMAIVTLVTVAIVTMVTGSTPIERGLEEEASTTKTGQVMEASQVSIDTPPPTLLMNLNPHRAWQLSLHYREL